MAGGADPFTIAPLRRTRAATDAAAAGQRETSLTTQCDQYKNQLLEKELELLNEDRQRIRKRRLNMEKEVKAQRYKDILKDIQLKDKARFDEEARERKASGAAIEMVDASKEADKAKAALPCR